MITAMTLGLSPGQSTAGWLVEAPGPPAAFLVGGVAGVAVAGLLWLRRGASLPPAQVVQLSAHG